jgi:hypothetical protein
MNENIFQELQSFFIIPNQQQVINVDNEKCIMTDDEKEIQIVISSTPFESMALQKGIKTRIPCLWSLLQPKDCLQK